MEFGMIEKNLRLEAVENGLRMDSIAPRMETYTERIETIKVELEKLKIRKPIIPRDKLKEWLEVFRSGDTDSDILNKRIIQTFISGIVVYDDHSVIIFNVSENKKDECSNLSRIVNHLRNQQSLIRCKEQGGD